MHDRAMYLVVLSHELQDLSGNATIALASSAWNVERCRDTRLACSACTPNAMYVRVKVLRTHGIDLQQSSS